MGDRGWRCWTGIDSGPGSGRSWKADVSPGRGLQHEALRPPHGSGFLAGTPGRASRYVPRVLPELANYSPHEAGRSSRVSTSKPPLDSLGGAAEHSRNPSMPLLHCSRRPRPHCGRSRDERDAGSCVLNRVDYPGRIRTGLGCSLKRSMPLLTLAVLVPRRLLSSKLRESLASPRRGRGHEPLLGFCPSGSAPEAPLPLRSALPASSMKRPEGYSWNEHPWCSSSHSPLEL